MTRRGATREEATLVIETVGARGDGVAYHAGKPIYLPFTAPGDSVKARLGDLRGSGREAELIELLSPGARQAPVCRHFGSCGGCALQHLDDDAYRRMKEAQVEAALAQHGLTCEIAPLRRLAPGTRRRARFAIRRPSRPTAPPVVGFSMRARHQIIDMQVCAALHPAVFGLVKPLREIVPLLWPAGSTGAATVTLGDTGLDVLIDLATVPDLAMLETLGEFAARQDLARLAWRALDSNEPTPVAIRRPPRIVFAGIPVDLPGDAFLQASAEAEEVLVREVLAGVGDGERVADLFAGLGTFTFALAEHAIVHAVEGSQRMVAALSAAASRAGLDGRITAETRDLERQPLLADELKRSDAVVFDPPRAGATAQSAALAASAVPRIAAVSCNPASFARDARSLVDGGYRLTHVQPIDQFVWSPHVELVARFER